MGDTVLKVGKSTKLQTEQNIIKESTWEGEVSGQTSSIHSATNLLATSEDLVYYIVWSAAQLHIFINQKVQIDSLSPHDLQILNFSNCSINSLERFFPLLAPDHDFP